MSTEHPAAVRRLWLSVRTFMVAQAKLREARRQTASPAWNQVGAGLVVAALIWSATYFLVSYPQAALQIEADSAAFAKVDIESQQLSDLTKVEHKIFDHYPQRTRQMRDILRKGSLANRRKRGRLDAEIVSNEDRAARDLGAITPFEDIGFDYARDEAKSIAGLLNAELGVWYSEEDLVGMYNAGTPTGSRARSARRQIERQVIVYDSKVSQLHLALEETASMGRATVQNAQTQSNILRSRVKSTRFLYYLSFVVIMLALVRWLCDALLRLFTPNGARRKSDADTDRP